MAFAHQVGGHANTILASPLSASTLIKPSSARELAFYQHLAPSLDPHLVGEWTPAFYGTLKLAGKVHPEGGVAQVPPATDVEPEMLVLENLTYRFVRPNVLDIKLGTQLFDEDASPDKQDRMRRAALASTSARAGVRLTGFQVWDHGQQTYVQTDKPFGRALTVDELPLGMARFFYPPLSGPSAAERAAAATATTSSSTASLNPSTSTPTAPTPPPPTPLALPLPLPLHLLLPVLRTLVRRLDDLVHTWSRLALRMRGGSLLVVVEGDPDALERALERAQDEADKTAKAARARRERGLREEGEGEGEGEGVGEREEEEGDDDDADSVSTATSGGTAAPHTLQAFDVRVIDFAHTRALVDGEEGPDEGVLTGLRTVRALVDGLVERLTELQRSEEDEARER